MPSIFSHAIVAVALKEGFSEKVVPRRLMMMGAVCAMAPDLDVIGFGFGIPYGSMWGHRGISHSITFAVLLSGAVVLAESLKKDPQARLGWAWLYLFLATVSHGLLDALTNGGRGVALFAPFNNTRYFFPWDPIEVSPIGGGFFSARGLHVLANEFLWLWLPSLVFAGAAILIRYFWRKQRAAA